MKKPSAEMRRVTGAKVTITHLVIKAIGKILKEMPSVNGHLVMGRYYPAETADVGCLVAIDTPKGPDLANAKVSIFLSPSFFVFFFVLAF